MSFGFTLDGIESYHEFAKSHPKIAKDAGADIPHVVHTFYITLPQPGFESARIDLLNIGYSPHFGYRGYVYLHPAGVDFMPQSKRFREEYLVGFYSIWNAHSEGMKTSATVDVTSAISRLVPGESGKVWRVSVSIAVPDHEGAREYFAGKDDHLKSLKEETSIGDLVLVVE